MRFSVPASTVLSVAMLALVHIASGPATAQEDPISAANAAYYQNDYATALRLFRQLADQGNAEAQTRLGELYAGGYGGLERSPDEAERWFKLAAAQDYSKAKYRLGELKRFSDPAESMRWNRLAAEGGYAIAQSDLGRLYELGGSGVSRNDKEAVRWYTLAADQGFARAQNALGDMYSDGRGVARDQVQAYKWYDLASSRVNGAGFSLTREAADQRNSTAAKMTPGQIAQAKKLVTEWRPAPNAPRDLLSEVEAAEAAYARGDFVTAFKLSRRPAEQGNASAQTNLANMYLNGRGVTQDYAEAERWTRLAADQGYARAQFNLGVMFAFGQGRAPDYAEAIRWYMKAAVQGYAIAQSNLGSLYRDGRGVARDYAEAVRFFIPSAAQGEAYGQWNLGQMYDNGWGLARDDVQALKWYDLAIPRFSARQTEARDLTVKAREILAARMTPAQIAEAQRLARDWKPTM